MPPSRGGRASKACSACRKQKTRCYEGESGSCLRCCTLNLTCSLVGRGTALSNGRSLSRIRLESRVSTQDDDRLAVLEQTVIDLVQRLDAIERSDGPDGVASPQQRRTIVGNEEPPAPVVLLREVADEVGRSPEDRRLAVPPSRAVHEDVITKGYVTYETAITMIAIFQEHYGRWVALEPECHAEETLRSLRKSPLLLCAACLIAVRHVDVVLAASLVELLFAEAKQLLSASMLTVPQGLPFFRAAVILSFWSTTIGTTPLSLDSWLLSGIALQHCIASGFPWKSEQSMGPDARESQAQRGVWNHLCLSHLHYCVGTRRKAVLDRQQLDQSQLIKSSANVSDFEIRIVAEVELYWIMYEQCCVQGLDLPKLKASLKSWREEWTFVFEKPRATFLQMGLYFAELLAYDRTLPSRSSAVQETLILEMTRLSSSILHLAMNTADERTKHLSDHIYHMIAFSAVSICRLANRYRRLIAASQNLTDLDELVLRTVTWLHSVGPTCHVAHTFGDIVADLHKKMRPDAQLTSPTSSYQDADPVYDAEFASLFPDLISFDIVDGLASASFTG